MELKFDAQGLIPAVVQDAETGAVLMVAWMNEEALQRTEETGEAHFWSRSRQELWHKGATSGNVQRVQEIRVDCDADTLLLRVDPAGPACHTGEQSCFYRMLAGEEGVTAAPGEILGELFALLQQRRVDAPAGSYTAQLLQAGEDEIIKKVGEEAVEIILAAKGQGNERLVEESADLLYHLLVLLVARDLEWQDVLQELARRRR